MYCKNDVYYVFEHLSLDLVKHVYAQTVMVRYLLLWICNTNHTCIPYVWLYCGFQISWELFLRRSGVILNHLQKGCSHWTPIERIFLLSWSFISFTTVLMAKKKRNSKSEFMFTLTPLNWVGYIYIYNYIQCIYVQIISSNHNLLKPMTLPV